MKVLVFTHELGVGGSVVNGIELAAALRDMHGFDVVVYGTPGPMVRLVEQLKLKFIAAPIARLHPSLKRMRHVEEVIQQEKPDLVHVWDWFQCLDAYVPCYLKARIPMVVTDMMMNLTRVLPKELPTTFGTPELVDEARSKGRRQAQLLLPPVDVHLNAPGAVDTTAYCEQYRIKKSDINLVTVSRVDAWMKKESLYRTVEAVRTLGREFPLRFVVVGDGTERPNLQRRADEVNAELGREAVTLTGQMIDPRAAYQASDIVVGMGGSSLRGLAFGKPVVVVGEKGYSDPFNPQTADSFYYRGMYGFGNGNPSNEKHVADIRSLVEHPEKFAELGEFSRQFVLANFSMETVSAKLAEICRRAIVDIQPMHTIAMDTIRTAAVYLRERRFQTPSRDAAPPVTQAVRN